MAKKFRANTLGEFITQQQNAFPYANGDLSRLLTHIGIASKIVNREVNISIGTVFSIYRRISKAGGPSLDEDFLQPGTRQVAAGYVLYGSSTMLVYTTGMGVTGFTLDPSIGEFFLSHAKIVTPDKGPFYSINEGKLRLTYECNPIAFLAEQSGGTATDGRGQRIMEIRPEDIHQRVPFFTGSPKMMKQAEDLMRLYG